MSIKISENTLMVLGNMAKLNPHLVIEAGSKIRSINEHGTKVIEYEGDEVFPTQVAFHDLSGFLKVISLFNDPDFDFREKFVKISDSLASQTYYYSDLEGLTYDNAEANEIDFSINFVLDGNTLTKVLSAASINAVDVISFVGRDGAVYLEASDPENPTRKFSIIVCEENHGEFNAQMKQTKKQKINLLPLDYQVQISELGAIRFSTDITDFNISYFMALEAESVFGGQS